MGPASGGIHHKTCCLFCCCLKAVMANNGVVIEQMDSQQPNTHQPVPSRAAISFNKKWKPIHWKKKQQFSPQLVAPPCIWTGVLVNEWNGYYK
jgi:hypothetical protein